MSYLHDLKKKYMLKQITEAEYKKEEEKYLNFLIKLFSEGRITEEEFEKHTSK